MTWLVGAHGGRDQLLEEAPAEPAIPASAAAAVEWLRALAVGWNRLLDSAPDLDVPVAYPWSDPRPARYTLAWVNVELVKNLAEIGAVRHLWAASRDQS